MSDPQVYRLPKWAQQYIKSLERDLAEARGEATTLSGVTAMLWVGVDGVAVVQIDTEHEPDSEAPYLRVNVGERRVYGPAVKREEQ